MKKVILFSFTFFLTLTVQSEITYTNYGNDGWHIALNENVIVDVDQDGFDDFFINGHLNELGFVPIFAQGCFSSPGASAINNIGSRELTIHQAGDILDYATVNTLDFIDEDRGSAYTTTTNEFADGWVDGQDVYLGFYIFTTKRFGWMRVAIDADAQELIIKEIAYEDSYTPIIVGDIGQPQEVAPILIQQGKTSSTTTINETTTNTNELEKEVKELTISPNPASEKVNISMTYEGTENLSIVVTNSVGKEMYRVANNIPTGEVNVEIPVSKWASGIYFIQFQNIKGIKTERLFVVK